MDETKHDILKGVTTGFVDKKFSSKTESQPTLLLNDKGAGKKVLTYILRELKTCNEFWFSVAFLTKGGLMALINSLKKTTENDVKGKILVSQYLNFTQPQALRTLLQFPNIETRIVTDGDFHSKGYLFQKTGHFKVVIGSSNLTGNALSSNTELNIAFSASNDSQILGELTDEFRTEFRKSTTVDEAFIETYQAIYDQAREARERLEEAENGSSDKILNTEETSFEVEETQANFDSKLIQNALVISPLYKPNAMQMQALANLKALRKNGGSKGLLISATGTGKTFLSAFDVQALNSKKMLFVVHRRTIALKAKETFKKVFGKSRTYGVFSGNSKDTSSDFIFSTIQTISKPENFEKFKTDHFDYIVLDETHRAGAKSYQPIFDYFKPQFLLGMTATPERTDGYNIFEKFDHNIAHEIRLHDAMSENMLCPFHYFGISDIVVDGEEVDDLTLFKKLTSDERINHIIEHIKFYGTDDDITRGLIFCSTIEECKFLSASFNKRGFKTVALSGGTSEDDRLDAIRKLESNDPALKIDYIFSVDIFNEGVDIPSLNQIVMLRPTQSAIVFVQQLGRGLRKSNRKNYLTVIDFIGNYQSNYLVPVALYGDTSYSKDTLRKLMASGSGLIPGSSTINFDEITAKRIYEAIDQANLQTKKELVKDYDLLKFKLGKIPSMVDFVEHGSRDPQLYVERSKSYYNFVLEQEKENLEKIGEEQKKLLELFAKEINNSKRVVESFIISLLLNTTKLNIIKTIDQLEKKYGVRFSIETIESACANLNFEFVTERKNKKLVSVQEIYGIETVALEEGFISLGKTLEQALRNKTFRKFFRDNTEYSILAYEQKFKQDKFIDGFILYEKYSRKDVFRILNWKKNPLAQNVGGYKVSESDCAIFVNYHKSDDISDTTKYEDRFISPNKFAWMSKSKRTINSPDVTAIRNASGKLRLPLFVKKSNDEGTEFYYMGELTPIDESFEQTTMPSGDTEVSVVKVNFDISPPVQDAIFEYITDS